MKVEMSEYEIARHQQLRAVEKNESQQSRKRVESYSKQNTLYYLKKNNCKIPCKVVVPAVIADHCSWARNRALAINGAI